MDHFAVLRIEPTTDLHAIKKAYVRLVKLYPPETHSGEFQQIREAYEKAQAAATAGLSDSRAADDPVEQFAHRLKELYQHYESRISAEAWKALLDLDVCHHIDTRDAVSRKVLDFLTDDFNIPYPVWQALEEHFAWEKKKDQLLGEYSSDFVEFVMNRTKRDYYFHYEELLQCENGQQDILIGHYRDGMRAIDQYDYYAAQAALNQAQAICPDQSDVAILSARYSTATGRLDEACQKLTALLERNGPDYYPLYHRAGLLFRTGRHEDAYRDYEAILPMRPDAADVLFSLAQCAVSLEKYTEGIHYLNQLGQILPNDHEVINLVMSAHRFRIDRLTASLSASPQDEETAQALVESYLATNQAEEGYKLLCELEQHHPSVKLYAGMIHALDKLDKKALALTTVNKALDSLGDEVDLLHWKAHLLEELGSREEALQYYDKVIARDPSSSVSHNNKAYLLNLMNRYEEALESAEQAIAGDPHYPNAYRHKAEALLNLERYEECYEACEAALARNPHYLEAYLTKMRMLTSVARYPSAIEVFHQAVRHELTDSRLYAQQALALRYLGDFESAIHACEQAIEADLGNQEAMLYKGICHIKLQQYPEAIAEFDRLMTFDPSEEARYYAALSYYNGGRHDEALSMAQEVLQRGAERGDVFYDLIGDIHRDSEESELAIEAYRAAVGLNPSSASYHLQLGLLLEGESTWEESLHHLNEAAALDPSMIRALEKKIHVLYTYGKAYQACLDVCDELFELVPEHSDVYDYRAWSYYMLQDKEQALASLRDGLQMHPNHVSMLHLKLVLLMDNGQGREALAVCDRILDLDPDHQNTRARRAELLGSDPKKSVFKWFKK